MVNQHAAEHPAFGVAALSAWLRAEDVVTASQRAAKIAEVTEIAKSSARHSNTAPHPGQSTSVTSNPIERFHSDPLNQPSG